MDDMRIKGAAEEFLRQIYGWRSVVFLTARTMNEKLKAGTIPRHDTTRHA